MSSSEAVPVWGVLTKANELEIRRTLARLREELDLSQLIYISAGEWTAAFFTEPSDTSYQGAAKLLQESGFSPVYRFDFSRHEDLAFFWDGASWKQAEEPGSVLSKVGLWIPGWGSGPLTIDPDVAVIERRVAILEGTTLANAKVLLGDDSIGVRAGPLGAIVHDPDLEVRFKLWTQAPNRVFDVLYYPKSKKLWLKVMKGETCLGTFRPGETRTWDGTPFLADFEGATTAEGVIDKLGIPRSFLDPLPRMPTANGGP